MMGVIERLSPANPQPLVRRRGARLEDFGSQVAGFTVSTAQRGESAKVISSVHAAARTSIALRSVVVQAVPVDASALVGAPGVD